MSNNIIDKIQLSGVTYDIGGSGGGSPTVELTQAEYNALVTAGTVSSNTYYIITDAEAGDLTQYWTSAQTNSAITEAVSGKADTATTYTKTEVDNAITAATATKQDTLVSSENIKTINNISILGSGNIDIQGGGGKVVSGGTNISITTGETADTINCTLPMFSGSAVGALKINHKDNVASGIYSNAEGTFTTASRESAHAEGKSTTASGNYSHAEGYKTTASDISAHAEGEECVASGERSHAEGYKTTASTYNSHTEGYYTVAYNSSEHSNGKYNVSNTGSTTADKTLFSVGNGTSSSARHNAFEIRQNGDIYLSSGGTDIKLQDYLGQGGGGEVSSAITSGDTNAVESKAIWSATTYNKEVTLQWDNGFPSKLSTNYPSGCKKFVVTVLSDTDTLLRLSNGGSQLDGYINISNYSSLSVSIDTFEGITYTISGNDVTFVIPNTITFDQLICDIRTITSIKAIVEGAWIADNTYMKEEVDAIQNTLQNNINQKLDATAYTPVTIDSSLIENSTNPVEGGVLYDELIYKGAASETTIEWSGSESTNYPSGCTEIKVEVSGSMNGMYIDFFDDNWQRFGNVYINNYGNITVAINDLNATYEISGTTVTISYPSVTGVTKINSSGTATYTTKAVTYGASTTVKDALGGLKFVKLTQTEYDNLQTKDNNTLYVIVN